MPDTLNNPNRGAAGLVLAAMMVIGAIDAAVPLIAETAGLFQFHLTRASIVLPILFFVMRARGVSVRPHRWWAVALRSGAIAVAMMIYFGALAFLPVGQVVAALFTAPIFVLLITVMLPGGRVGWVEGSAILLGFAGVLVVLKPSAGMSGVALVPILAGLAYGISAVVTRRLCAEESVLVMLWWFFCTMAGLSVIGLGALAGFSPQPEDAVFVTRGWVAAPGALFYTLCTVQALGAMFALGCLTRAYTVGDPPVVAGMEYSLLIFAAFWAWVLLAQIPTATTLAGSVLILLSGAAILTAQRQKSAYRGLRT